MRTQDKAVLESALGYSKKGLPVFPVHHPTDNGCSCRKRSCAQVGKHPAVPNGFKDSTLDEKQIRKWYEGKFKGYNIGVLCGIGYVCLDVDPKNAGLESFEELIQDHEPLPDTWIEETGEDKSGERGRHYWFLLPTAMRDEVVLTRKPLPGYLGVDLLATNQYAIVAPSRHVSGVQYDTLVPLEDVAECPNWLLGLTKVTEEDFSIRLPDGHTMLPTGIRPGPEVRRFLRSGDVPEGGQQPMMIKAARALWGLWVDLEDATEMVWDAIQKCDWGAEPWTREQVAFHIAHTYNSAPKDLDLSAEILFTDLGNAQRLGQLARGNLKYAPATGLWYHYDTTCWRTDTGAMVNQLVSSLSFKEFQKAAFIEDPERSSPIRKNAVSLQASRGVTNTIYMAKADPSFVIDPDEFDQDLHLLNFTNATVDLRSGEAREQRREDYISRVTRGAYYSDAQSELWEETLDLALDGDKDLIEYMQMAFGQALFGVTHEHVFYYLFGPGGTGKTTVLEAVRHVLGSYAGVADPESFMQSPNATPGGTRADLASLRGKRFVISTEIAAQSKFSTATVNRLTGADTVTVRIPYARHMLSFKPEWTLFFAANHFPSVSASKRDGFWRRAKIIPFEHQLRTEEMNPVLPHLLARRENVEGILAWLVEGAVRWWEEYGSQYRPMPTPVEVVEETAHVQEEADPLSAFYQTLVFEEGTRCTKHEMFEHYQGWADKEGVKMPLTQKTLSRHLKQNLDLEDGVTGDNQRVWKDVEIKPVVRVKGK